MSVTKVILPKLGLTMDEGKILAWHKQEGDRVAAGDVLFETETDKATMEVEAAVAGYLRRIVVPASDRLVPVTTVVALIADSLDEALPALASAGVEPLADNSPAPASSLSSSSSLSPSAPSDESRVRSSPAARKRAAELGVDIGGVNGTGPGGRISLEDVEAAAKAGGAVPATGSAAPATGSAASATTSAAPAGQAGGVTGERREPLTRMRRAIAERMTYSVTHQPQYSISRDVEVSAANEARKRAGVSWNDLIVATAARALRDHPRLRARIEGDAIVTAERVHVGVAVALDDGLIVPVIRDADQKTLAGIAAARAAVEDGARSGKLPGDALGGGVLTVSNLGTFGVDRFTAIVNPPECAILAVGRVSDRVVVRDGAPAVRPVLSLTLSVDHRVADGATAARFLADVAERLEAGRLD